MATTGKPTGVDGTDGANRLFVLAVAGIVVIGLAVVAVLATRGDDAPSGAGETGADEIDPAIDTANGSDGAGEESEPDPGDGAETASVAVTGEAIASMEQGVAVVQSEGEAAVGTIAPTLVGTGFDGAEVRIEADGRPKVVYFLAHWCPHCQREVPALVGLIDAGKQPEGLDLYAVSTAVDDGGPNFPPSDWLAAEGVPFPIMRDSAEATALTAYGPSGFPYAVYLDGENRVVAQSAGQLDENTIEQLWNLTAAG